jgi:D-sedoheptulose 7-phosphate isomerase
MVKIENEIASIIESSISTKQKLINDETIDSIKKSIDLIVDCYKLDGKVLFVGNGGSAADAQHLAAELSGRFYFDRDPLASEALHVNTSYVTAVANDYSYEEIYSRYIKGVGKKGDILIGLSTSGRSKNIIKAFDMAKSKNMICIGLTGENIEEFSKYCDVIISVPSKDTPRIQESHITIGHIICQKVEEIIFKK